MLLFRFLTKMVFRDALNQLMLLISAFVLFYAYVAKEIPPSELRRLLLQSDPFKQAMALSIGWFLYTWLTRPLVSILIASNRLHYLRSLPIAPQVWRNVHVSHLLLINIPWFFMFVYGYWGSGPRFSWIHLSFWGTALLTATLCLQVLSLTHSPGLRPSWNHLLWLGVLAGLYVLCRWPGIFLVSGVIICSSYFLNRQLQKSLQLRRERAFSLKWLPANPWLAQVWLEGLCLVRRLPRKWLRGLLCQLALGGMLCFALLNNQITSPQTFYRIALPFLLPGFLCGVASLVDLQLLRFPSMWLAEHHGISTRVLFTARLALGGVLCLPYFLLLLTVGGYASVPLSVSLVLKLLWPAIILTLWCTCLLNWQAYFYPLDKEAKDSVLVPVIGRAMIPQGILIVLPEYWLLLLPLLLWHGKQCIQKLQETRTYWHDDFYTRENDHVL